MSSITTAQHYEAIVNRNGQPTGPVRLPMVDRQMFIDAFNRRYQNAGLSITGVASSDPSSSLIHKADTVAIDTAARDPQ